MILFDLGTGLREAEILGVQDKYIEKQVKVRKQLQKIKRFKNRKSIGYTYKLITPKTPSSIRNVDLPTAINQLMSNFKDIQKNKWEALGKEYNSTIISGDFSSTFNPGRTNRNRQGNRSLEQHCCCCCCC